jgi:hypothetical protein
MAKPYSDIVMFYIVCIILGGLGIFRNPPQKTQGIVMSLRTVYHPWGGVIERTS